MHFIILYDIRVHFDSQSWAKLRLIFLFGVYIHLTTNQPTFFLLQTEEIYKHTVKCSNNLVVLTKSSTKISSASDLYFVGTGLSTWILANAKSQDIKAMWTESISQKCYSGTIMRASTSVIVSPAEMPENETVGIHGVLLSNETFHAFPE